MLLTSQRSRQPVRADQFAEKRHLGHGRVAEAEIARRVLDEIGPAEALLHLVDVPRDHGKRFLVVGERQEVVEVFAGVRRPGEMPGDEEGVDAVAERAHAGKVRAVDAADAADRYADGVHGYRIVGGKPIEQFARVRIGEKILGMDLEPPYGGPGGRDLGEMRKPQADAGGRGTRFCP